MRDKFTKMNNTEAYSIFKVVLVGESGVGKTSIANRFCEDNFSDETSPTIGSACIKKKFETSKGQVLLNIWDTAGQERFQSLIPMYIKGSSACIIVVDLSTNISFEDLSLFYDYIYDQLDPNCFICICGNKTDLVSPDVDISQLNDFARHRNCLMYKASAKTGVGVPELFQEIALHLLENRTGDSNSNKLVKRENRSKGCC